VGAGGDGGIQFHAHTSILTLALLTRLNSKGAETALYDQGTAELGPASPASSPAEEILRRRRAEEEVEKEGREQQGRRERKNARRRRVKEGRRKGGGLKKRKV
jgi:hypothetical protein